MSSQSASGGSKTTYPYKSPPPIAAIQHSRCLLALTAIRVCIDEIDRDAVSDPFREQLARIETLLDRCSKDIRDRELSAGARRDLNRAFTTFAAKSGIFGKSGDDLFYAWGCSMWCAMSLHDDCMATCPAYYRGSHWHKLNLAMEELCISMDRQDARIGTDGFKLYEEVCIVV